jgi:ribosomal protein L34
MQQFRCEIADEEQGKLVFGPQDGLKRRKEVDLHRMETEGGRKVVNRECAKVPSRGWRRKGTLVEIKV